MKNTKYMLIDAQLYDYAYLEKKLTRLAAEGWHLEKAGNLLWKFCRGEPKAVRYAVTYAPSASAFNSRPTDEEEDLTDLCAQAGWVRVANQAQRHIYRNDDPNATPLETDEGERLKNIRKTMFRHFFPQELFLIALFLLQFYMHCTTMSRSPVRTLSSVTMISALGMCLFVAAVHGILALDGLLWLDRARRAVDSGEPVPENRFYRRLQPFLWMVLLGYLVCLLLTAGLAFFGWVIFTSAAMLLVVTATIELCKRLNAPRWVNIAAPMILGCITIAVLAPMLIFSTETEGPPPAEDLPVTLTQLTGETGTQREIMEEDSTFLCAYGRYWDTGADDVRITYTIVDVKCPLFYDMLLNEQEQQFLMGVSHVPDPEIGRYIEFFDAEYVRHGSNGLGDRYLICWDSRIVHLRASWELTNEQLQTIKNSLMP